MKPEHFSEWLASLSEQQQVLISFLMQNFQNEDHGLDMLENNIREYSQATDTHLLSKFSRELHIETNTKELNSDRIILGSLGPLRNLAKVDPASPPIFFAIDGVTVVFGYNGSGKSSYCRVAKHLCRPNSNTDLRSNVFEDGTQEPIEADIRFQDRQGHINNLSWRYGDIPHPDLSSIMIFDSLISRLLIDSDQTIEILPSYLGFLEESASALATLGNLFRKNAEILKLSLTPTEHHSYSVGSEAFALIERLSVERHRDEIPTEEELRDAGHWSTTDETQLKALQHAVGNDLSATLTSKKGVLRLLNSLLSTIIGFSDVLNANTSISLSQASKRKIESAANLVSIGEDLFKDDPIAKTGSELWRRMAQHARAFAAESAGSPDEPLMAKHELCVLCQQPLSDVARQRLERFDKFILEQFNKDAEVAANELFEFRSRIDKIDLQQIGVLLDSVAAVQSGDLPSNLANLIETYMKDVSEIRNKMLRAISEEMPSSLSDLDDVDASLQTVIKEVIITTEVEVEKLVALSSKVENLDNVQQQLDFLKDRKQLTASIDFWIVRRQRLLEFHEEIRLMRICSTQFITRGVTQLRRRVFTPNFKKLLDAELKLLRLGHLKIVIEDWGDIGASKLRLKIDSKQPVNKVSDIFSEGEQTSLALAFFLAHAHSVGHKDAMIFDDPVSSLDHTRMEIVARRLVAEAGQGRQIVIFTHNIGFQFAIMSEAREQRVRVRQEWVSRVGSDVCGVVEDSQRPWVAMKVKDRVSDVQNTIQALSHSMSDDEYVDRKTTTEVCTKMREIWEKSIEEILFSDVVGRFRPDIQTLRIRSAYVDDEDKKSIFEGMKWCSTYSGHDAPSESAPALPVFSELRKRFAELKGFIDAASIRQKSLDSDKSYEKGPLAASVL